MWLFVYRVLLAVCFMFILRGMPRIETPDKNVKIWFVKGEIRS